MNLVLDGSDSFDPDAGLLDKAGMHFEWYCRRMDEAFPVGYKAGSKTSGCFKDGRYNLSVATKSQIQTKVSHFILIYISLFFLSVSQQ